MKAKVAAGEHPWIDSWTALVANPKAQPSYRAKPSNDMGSNRQRASADAVAAYLNALRWSVSDDQRCGDCAIAICNDWSAKVNIVHGRGNDGGLDGIAAYEFALAGELLRDFPGWKPQEFARFKSMLTTYLYPGCHDFLIHHAGTDPSYCWANWDLCNMTAILAMGVLCDDRAKFDEAIDYFKNGNGNGSITHAVPFLYPNGLGQWQETGRDQEHAQLGVGMMATFCQIAWNQGQDMYGYDNNRFLAGAEYVAAYNQWKPVPYTFYNNSVDVNNYWASEQTWGGRGRLQRPIWEMIYNHYAVLKRLSAPNVKAMAELYRPEGIEHDDNLGFGTLAYTLDAKASAYPPAQVPAAPRDLVATAGIQRVWLRWTPTPTANGYTILRGTKTGGPYEQIASYSGLFPVYEDSREDDQVSPATTYYYVVSAKNQAGSGANSTEANAAALQAGALPRSWAMKDIGTHSAPGEASYGAGSNPTYLIRGSGDDLGGKADGICFVYLKFHRDCSFTVRRAVSDFAGGKRQKIGIVFRESLEPESKSLAMVSGDVGAREARFGTRTSEGAAMTWRNGNAYTTPGPPTWFRLTRKGDTFAGYQSIDGIIWFEAGKPTTVQMKPDFVLGFAIASNSSKADVAHFDHVTVENMK